MENLEIMIVAFLVINTTFVFRQKLWKKSISTPIIILASDLAYALYSYGLINSAIGVWGLAITGLVANSAYREHEPYCSHRKKAESAEHGKER